MQNASKSILLLSPPFVNIKLFAEIFDLTAFAGGGPNIGADDLTKENLCVIVAKKDSSTEVMRGNLPSERVCNEQNYTAAGISQQSCSDRKSVLSSDFKPGDTR